MADKLEPRNSFVPGARTRITVDIAEEALPLLHGGLVNAERVWLEDNGDGTYGLCATQTLGELRKEPGKPAVDILVELLNGFADVLEGDDVPDRIAFAWDTLIEDYKQRTWRPPDRHEEE